MKRRVIELDVLRGMSVIGMILVIVPGDWGQRFEWLNHAEWRGCTLADMIFPTFLLSVGFSMILSINKRIAVGKANLLKHILVRGSLLVGLGFLLGLLPDFNFDTVRIPGVLQRIGFCYMLVGVIVVFFSRSEVKENRRIQIKLLVISATVIALTYWLVLNFIPLPGSDQLTPYDPDKSWPAYVDRHIFGINHLWIYGQTKGLVTYDPEGLLSTFPACMNVIAGAVMGLLYKMESKYFKPVFLCLSGLSLMLVGWLLDTMNIDPIIKKIWTPSFALFSSGFSAVVFSVIMISNKGIISKLYFPARVFGANALLGFLIAMLSGQLIDKPLLSFHEEASSLRHFGFTLLNQLLGSAPYGSFIFSLTYLVVAFLILNLLYQRNMFLRL